MYAVATADELRELAELIDCFGENKREFQALIEKMIAASPNCMGYAVHHVRCRNCGDAHLTISPVPQEFPIPCWVCGETEVYIVKSAGED